MSLPINLSVRFLGWQTAAAVVVACLFLAVPGEASAQGYGGSMHGVPGAPMGPQRSAPMHGPSRGAIGQMNSRSSMGPSFRPGQMGPLPSAVGGARRAPGMGIPGGIGPTNAAGYSGMSRNVMGGIPGGRR